MNKKNKIYWAFIIMFSIIIWIPLLYHTSIIFSPTVPQNLEVVEQWSEYKTNRLIRYIDCRKLPYDNVPEELLELKRVCGVLTTMWLKKYRANQIEDLINKQK